MIKKIGQYRNGNYNVKIYEDGTKIRETEGDEFLAEFPESMDVKITNKCDMGCPMCHENSVVDGKHGDILSPKFLDTLRPFTEIAIGGGNPLEHPDLLKFLAKLRDKRIIANMTVNQTHFEKNFDYIKLLCDMGYLKAVGVSVTSVTEEFISKVKSLDNVVLHTIIGLTDMSVFESLKDNDLKILLLGYKIFRRGLTFLQADDNYEAINDNCDKLEDTLKELIPHFKIVSFDNLALEQLDVRKILSKEKWDEFYMGDDGKHTMYVDLVEGMYARSSVSAKRYPLKDDICDIFADILA